MELTEARQQFIQSWGVMGSQWGINRTMSQVHALLLISEEALCADDIMAELNISRGNANMNIRALLDWGLVYKHIKAGERKEYFVAEKDLWTAARKVIKERKKRELEPVLDMLETLNNSEFTGDAEEVRQFSKRVADVRTFARQSDKLLSGIVKSDRKWFLGGFAKLFGK